MNRNLVIHTGGWEASEADVRSAVVPSDTQSYVALPHARLLEEVRFNLPRFNLTEERSRFALAKNGDRFFGVMDLGFEGFQKNGHGLVLGLRNSYDKSMSVGLVAGSRVFVCDNMAFHGDVEMKRMHKKNLFRDLPSLLYEMLEKTMGLFTRQDEFIHQLRGVELDRKMADHLMIEAVRRDAIPANKLPKVMAEWDKPSFEEFAPRNAWSLFNAFTYVQKERSPWAQVDDTIHLTRLFGDKFGVKEADVVEVA